MRYAIANPSYVNSAFSVPLWFYMIFNRRRHREKKKAEIQANYFSLNLEIGIYAGFNFERPRNSVGFSRFP
ncbi:hypothetical protein FDUTEX481_07300 [Tolypothrix sp. PCC 7601]|nr:hypothetical protein FDUTEX481_07300 [Tolypothrix sp. PCC 7601]